jgi:membrane protein YqaA with SNARE-associated domain
MILVWLTTCLFSLASALLPFLPMEVYILGAGAKYGDSTAHAIELGIAAGIGATFGKIIVYQLALHGSRVAWVQRKLAKPKVAAAYERWTTRMQGRPWYAAAIMFIAASVGIPPLLAMAAVAGFLKMPMWVFIPTVVVGRSIRFALLFMGVDVLHVLIR